MTYQDKASYGSSSPCIIWMSHVTYMKKSCNTYESAQGTPLTDIWMSHTTDIQKTCQTYELAREVSLRGRVDESLDVMWRHVTHVTRIELSLDVYEGVTPHAHTHKHTHTHTHANTHTHTHTNTHTHAHTHTHICIYIYICNYGYYKFVAPNLHGTLALAMGWLRLVGSLKLQVSFAKEPYKRDYILQKRPIILRSLLIVATP